MCLPSSLVNLTKLKWLSLANTQLCAPPDATFQRWLEGIETKVGVDNCEAPPGDPDPINPDRAVLVALYEATDGDNWKDNTNWLSDRPLGKWYGVTTNANGRVIELVLDDNDLSGALPSSLGNLTNLQRLHLYPERVIRRSLPSSLGSLTNLDKGCRLAVTGSRIVFRLSLGNLTNLQRLSLRGLQFSGELPSWLGNLTNLQFLSLDGNQFSGSAAVVVG